MAGNVATCFLEEEPKRHFCPSKIMVGMFLFAGVSFRERGNRIGESVRRKWNRSTKKKGCPKLDQQILLQKQKTLVRVFPFMFTNVISLKGVRFSNCWRRTRHFGWIKLPNLTSARTELFKSKPENRQLIMITYAYTTHVIAFSSHNHGSVNNGCISNGNQW